MLGTAAHLAWWTSDHGGHEPAEATAPIEIHVHPPAPRETVVTHVEEGSCQAAIPASTARPRAALPIDARGAVVCSDGGCTLRRSFVTRMLEEPALLGRATRLVPVLHEGRLQGLRAAGVFPGGLADLLGLVSGDTIVAIDGRPLESFEAVAARLTALRHADRVTLTLRHAHLVRTMRYTIIDG